MRTLIIGFGNPSRRDDGVALAVVNDLRGRLGLAALEEGDDGYEDLGRELDTLFLQQLNPELAETLAGYDRVVFVDAHVAGGGAVSSDEMIRRSEIEPADDPGLVSHHFKPARLLALSQTLYGRAPAAELLSVAGFDFDFGAELSPDSAAAAERAAELLWQTFGAQPR